jgi:DNA-directed RNA polymerase subunit RPC12/RpoP
MNIIAFHQTFPDEQACKAHFLSNRLKKGVVCAKCSHQEHYFLKNKEQFQCKNCKFRTTLKSGTVLQNSKLPFQYWYIAMHLITSTKKSFSAHELRRQLGHKRYEPIWSLLHKIRHAMKPDSQLNMAVTVDDAFVSTYTPKANKASLKRGKGSESKSKITAMLENIPIENDNAVAVFCGNLTLIHNKSEKAVDAENIVRKYVNDKAVLFSDSALNYTNLKQCVSMHIKLDGKNFEEPMFKWTNIIISNLKRYLLGIFHCIKEDYLQNYLNEFSFKFNHRKAYNIFENLSLIVS